MLQLREIVSGFRRSLLGLNFQEIQDYINNKCLNKELDSPSEDNSMKTTLDMGGNPIINVGDFSFVGSGGFATEAYVDQRHSDQSQEIIDAVTNPPSDVNMTGSSLTDVGAIYGESEGDLLLSSSYITLSSSQNEIVLNSEPYIGAYTAAGGNRLATRDYVTANAGSTGTTLLLSSFGLTEGGNIVAPMNSCISHITTSDLKDVTIVVDVLTATASGTITLPLGTGWPLKVRGIGVDGVLNRSTTTITKTGAPDDVFTISVTSFLGDKASKNTVLSFEMLKVVGSGRNSGQAFLGYNSATPPAAGFPKVVIENCEFVDIQTLCDAYGVAFLNLVVKECHLDSCNSVFNFSGTAPTAAYEESVEVRVFNCDIKDCSNIVKGAPRHHSFYIEENKAHGLLEKALGDITGADYLNLRNNYISCQGSVDDWLWGDWYTSNTKDFLAVLEGNEIYQIGTTAPSTMATTLGNVLVSGNKFDVRYNSNDYLIQVASNSTHSPRLFGNETAYRATAGSGGILGLFKEVKGCKATNRMSNSLQSSSNSVYQSGSYVDYYVIDYEDVAGEIGSNFFAIKVPDGARSCYVKVTYLLRDTTDQASMANGFNFYATYASQNSAGGYEEDQWNLSEETFDLDPYRAGNTRNVDVIVDTSKDIYFENTNTPIGDFLVVEMRGTGARTNPTATGNEDRIPQVKIEAYWV